MLSLKELRLANDEKITTASAMVATSGSTCTSTGCRSSYDAPTGAPPKGSGGGGNKKQGGWRGQGNANNGWQQGSSSGWQQGSNAQTGGNRPMGPWFCYNPWASQGGAPSGGRLSADVMTKGLPVQLFEDFRSSLCIRIPDASNAGG
jgi:hypothetical protein